MGMLNTILHEAGQLLLIPVMAALLLFILISLQQTGVMIVEYFMERRRFREDVPRLLENLQGKDAGGLRALIFASGLIRRQKQALTTLLASKLPQAERRALAESLLISEEKHYEKATRVTDLIAKLGPMLGLLGTLIPLGPGVKALGEGDTLILSQSLTTAFDTTIAGLVAAAICYTLSRVRHNWHDLYLQTTETLMECLLEELKAKEGPLSK
jgi:biopolymer transport protein ExbB/TolQ